MKLNIKATDLEVSPALSVYLDKKLAKLQKFLKRERQEVTVNVELGRETQHHRQGLVFRAEISFNLRGRDFYAAASAEDIYAAIDKVKDEIIRELQSQQNRDNTLLRRGGRLFKSMLRGFRRQ